MEFLHHHFISRNVCTFVEAFIQTHYDGNDLLLLIIVKDVRAQTFLSTVV